VTLASAVTPEPEAVAIRAPAGALFRNALRLWRTRIGLVLVVLLVLVAAVGPLFARYGPTAFVGIALDVKGDEHRRLGGEQARLIGE